MQNTILIRTVWEEWKAICQSRGVEKISALLCVSGGLDSMVLLDVMYRISLFEECREKLRIGVFHLNHKIRKEAKMDYKLVQEYCKERDLEFYGFESDMVGNAQNQGLSLETASRNYRYNMVFETFFKEKFDLVLTAHHLDDQAETLFMNIARGTGLKGLCAMSCIKHKLYRPLLNFSKKELLLYALKNEIVFYEDLTNHENTYTRNKIRNQVIPYIEDVMEVDFSKKLVGMSSLLRAEYDWKSGIVDAFFKEEIFYQKNLWEFQSVSSLSHEPQQMTAFEYLEHCKGCDPSKEPYGLRYLSNRIYDLSRYGVLIPKFSYKRLAPPVRAEILYQIFEKFNFHVVDIDRKNIEILDRFILYAEVSKFKKYKGLVFESMREHVKIMRESDYEKLCTEYEISLKIGENRIPHSRYMLDVEVLEKGSTEKLISREHRSPDTLFLSYDMLESIKEGRVILRNRREGDIIFPVDMPGGAKKIKKIMNEYKLSSDQKAIQPLVCIENTVLWMVGKRKSKFHIFDTKHEKAIRLKLNIV